MSAEKSFQVACDHCDASLAAVFCHSDGAFLCESCDAQVHSVNKIAQRHVRVPYTSCPVWAFREAKNKGRTNQAAGSVIVSSPLNVPLDIFDTAGGLFDGFSVTSLDPGQQLAVETLGHTAGRGQSSTAPPQLFGLRALHADLQRDLGEDPLVGDVGPGQNGMLIRSGNATHPTSSPLPLVASSSVAHTTTPHHPLVQREVTHAELLMLAQQATPDQQQQQQPGRTSFSGSEVLAAPAMLNTARDARSQSLPLRYSSSGTGMGSAPGRGHGDAHHPEPQLNIQAPGSAEYTRLAATLEMFRLPCESPHSSSVSAIPGAFSGRPGSGAYPAPPGSGTFACSGAMPPGSNSFGGSKPPASCAFANSASLPGMCGYGAGAPGPNSGIAVLPSTGNYAESGVFQGSSSYQALSHAGNGLSSGPGSFAGASSAVLPQSSGSYGGACLPPGSGTYSTAGATGHGSSMSSHGVYDASLQQHWQQIPPSQVLQMQAPGGQQLLQQPPSSAVPRSSSGSPSLDNTSQHGGMYFGSNTSQSTLANVELARTSSAGPSSLPLSSSGFGAVGSAYANSAGLVSHMQMQQQKQKQQQQQHHVHFAPTSTAQAGGITLDLSSRAAPIAIINSRQQRTPFDDIIMSDPGFSSNILSTSTDSISENPWGGLRSSLQSSLLGDRDSQRHSISGQFDTFGSVQAQASVDLGSNSRQLLYPQDTVVPSVQQQTTHLQQHLQQQQPSQLQQQNSSGLYQGPIAAITSVPTQNDLQQQQQHSHPFLQLDTTAFGAAPIHQQSWGPNGCDNLLGRYASQPGLPTGGDSLHDSLRDGNAAMTLLQSARSEPLPPQEASTRTGNNQSTGGTGNAHHTGRRSYADMGMQMVTRIERPDGTFKEVDPERAAQLYRYRVKRTARLKALAEGQKKIRYECRRTLAETRVRIKGRFAKTASSSDIAATAAAAATSNTAPKGLYAATMQQHRIEEEPPGSRLAGAAGRASTGASASAMLRRAASCADLGVSAAGGSGHGTSAAAHALGLSADVITDSDLKALGLALGDHSCAPTPMSQSAETKSEESGESMSTHEGGSGSTPPMSARAPQSGGGYRRPDSSQQQQQQPPPQAQHALQRLQSVPLPQRQQQQRSELLNAADLPQQQYQEQRCQLSDVMYAHQCRLAMSHQQHMPSAGSSQPLDSFATQQVQSMIDAIMTDQFKPLA